MDPTPTQGAPEPDDDPEDYPSVELAYPIALSSYETLLKRVDAQESRAQAFLAFVVAITVAVPAIASAGGISLKSTWFFVAISLFVLSALINVFGRLHGDIYLINPARVYETELHKTPWQFRKDAIYFAGQDYQRNNALILRRHRLSVWMMAVFVAEVAALAMALWSHR